MTDLILCREMHWTYDELKATPRWLVERLKLLLDVEARWKKSEQERGSRRS